MTSPKFRSLTLALASGVCVAALLGTASAQEVGKVEVGSKLFKQYCAACHGLDAKGDGPAALAFKTKPSDLTMIQKKGEAFPSMRVMGIIDGEPEVIAHGSREMPIWGEYFRHTEGEGKELLNINNLTAFLKSIQKFKE